MPYPTAAELVAQSTSAPLLALTAAQQAELYAGSVAAVEEFCGQKFDTESNVTKTFDGSGSSVLYLPKRLATLTALEVSGSSIQADGVDLSAEGDKIVVRPLSALSWGYYEQTLYDLDGRSPRSFVHGAGGVKITGTWGWPTFPSSIGTAIRKDMEDTAAADANLLSDSVRQFRRLGIRDISQGNLRASITGASGLSPVVMRLLQPYVWSGPIGVML